MGKLLSQYFGGEPPVDSSGQLEAAQKKAKGYSPSQEVEAKRAGYNSADEMYRRLETKQQGKYGKTQKPNSIMDLFNLHPARTLGRTNDKMAQALKQRDE